MTETETKPKPKREPEPEIRIAGTAADRAAAFRLRYELYVEQQGLFGDTADHERRLLSDALDEHAVIWVAHAGDQVVGTMRVCWGGEGRFDHETREAFNVDAFTSIVEEPQIAVASRILVLPAYRQGHLTARLLIEAARELAARQTEVLLGECEPHLVNTWSRFGLRPFGLCEHPINGTLVRMALVCGDLDHLRAVGSPLLPALEHRAPSGYAPRRLAARLMRNQQVISEATASGMFWARVEETLPLDRLAELLGGLTVEEFDSLLENSHALDCAPGAALIRKGHTSRTLYVLLTGSLEVLDEGARVGAVEREGELVGEVAFFTRSDRESDVIAGPGGARVLALSERSLDELIAQQNAGAAKFLLMTTRSVCQRMRGRSRPIPPRPAPRGTRAPTPPARRSPDHSSVVITLPVGDLDAAE